MNSWTQKKNVPNVPEFSIFKCNQFTAAEWFAEQTAIVIYCILASPTKSSWPRTQVLCSVQSSEAKGTHGVTAGKEKSAGFRFSLLLVMFIHSSTAYYKTQLHPMVMEGSSKLQIWKSVANMAELQGTKTPHSYSFQLGRGNACVPLQEMRNKVVCCFYRPREQAERFTH